MKPTAKKLRGKLFSIIREMAKHPEQYAQKPKRDFTRRRALTFETVVFLLLTMSEKSIGKVLMKHFGYKSNTPSASAFVQQRKKLLPSAMEELLRRFTASLHPDKSFQGYRLLAIDGSSLKSAAYPQDTASYRSGTSRQHGWNLWHINALYDLENGIYTDVLVQKEHDKNESRALCAMVDRSDNSGSAILLADRNYESFNNLAHLENKGWKYLIRIRERARAVAFGAKLPDSSEFDIPVRLTLGRLAKRHLGVRGIDVPEPYYHIPKQMLFDLLEPESDELYTMSFRIVRVQINERLTETFITNLDNDGFPPSVLRQLYARRWGIENSFRDLKYTVGLIHLRSKTPDLVLQEIYSAFIVYNFIRAVTWGVDTSQGRSRHSRHVNFSEAADACCAFLSGVSVDLYPLLERRLLPFRPDRAFPRPEIAENRLSFLYKSAR